jgi:hypothetical protein
MRFLHREASVTTFLFIYDLIWPRSRANADLVYAKIAYPCLAIVAGRPSTGCAPPPSRSGSARSWATDVDRADGF